MDPAAADEPHPDVQQILSMLEQMDGFDLSELNPEEARSLFESFSAAGSPPTEIETIEDDTISGPGGEIPIRRYDPGGPDGRPIVLYFHGGGWVIGNIETHDASCRVLADETGYVVVSVDYRLAPEHPFPAALEDCYAALEWADDQAASIGGDPDRIVVAGDSAGGNLAAAITLLTEHRDGPDPAYQVLVYPATGDAMATQAYEENAEGYFLTKSEMEWFRGKYFERDIDEGNIFAAPRLAHDLADVPPATVLTAGFDPLRDDGAAYAERLQESGIPVQYRNYPDMIHGFMGMLTEPAALEPAFEAYGEIADDLAAALE